LATAMRGGDASAFGRRRWKLGVATRNQLDEEPIDAAMSVIDRNKINGSSFEGINPRRFQKPAASTSTALTINARPPMRSAAATQRCNACLSSPVPIPLPIQF
jgi:hypothetical protein